MTDPLSNLSEHQRVQLASWLPEMEVVADLSWGLVETTVIKVRSAGRECVVKAGGQSDRHIQREIRAHRSWTEPWVRSGHAAALVHASPDLKLVVTGWLPGVLVEGSAAQGEPDTFIQAGALLARFHSQHASVDHEWHDRFRDRVQRFLDMPHRIDPDIVEALRGEVATWPGGAATVVPTHGDWQPRNWLIDNQTVRVIDFGRADLRPIDEDFVRLARQDFERDPALEVAFLEGYGGDAREPESWRRSLVGEAVGTAVWAYGVGDRDFEKFGHALLERLVGASSR